jgi:hypothetical protein
MIDELAALEIGGEAAARPAGTPRARKAATATNVK